MKKIICIFLSLMLLISITGCSTKQESDNQTPVKVSQINNPINLRFGTECDKIVRIKVPTILEEKCFMTYSAKFSEKWAQVTIYAVDGTCPVFTIYGTLTDNFKQFENEKGYEVIAVNDECYVVWYEHENGKENDVKYQEVIELIKQNYQAIKTQTIIAIENEEGVKF